MSTGETDFAPSLYIQRLKMHFGVKTDEEVASHIGVSKQAVANWRLRGKVPLRVQQQMLDVHNVPYSDWSFEFDGSDGDVVYAVTLYAFDKLSKRIGAPSIKERRLEGQIFKQVSSAVSTKLRGIKASGGSADTLIELLISYIDSGSFPELEAVFSQLQE